MAPCYHSKLMAWSGGRRRSKVEVFRARLSSEDTLSMTSRRSNHPIVLSNKNSEDARGEAVKDSRLLKRRTLQRT
jgi:hypothetical protein